MLLSLRAASLVVRPALRRLTSPPGRYVMALTRDQQRLRRKWREEAPAPQRLPAAPESIVVQRLRALEAAGGAETTPSLTSDLRALVDELDRMDEDAARGELSGLAKDAFRCGGCGVELQTDAADELGFIDPKLLADAIAATVIPATNKPSSALPSDALRRDGVVCRRCLLLSSPSPAASTLPSPSLEDCESVFAAIRDLPAATVVLVTDITDLEASVIPDLFSRLGGREYVVVGNKVDQLVPDRTGFLDRWRLALRKTAMRLAGIPRGHLRGLELVSARTGFGVENLVDVLTSNDLLKQPVFLLGCVNVGKSSLFNRLLQSDLCKAVARSHVPRATVSLWPGTTVSTVKFPLVTMTASQRRRRFDRLKAVWRAESTKLNRRLGNFYDPLSGDVGMTFEEEAGTLMEQHQGFTRLPTYSEGEEGETMLSSDYSESVVEERYLHKAAYDERLLSVRRWCHDTPGFPHSGQLANFLTLEEIAVLRGSQSRLRFLPRTFVLRPGRSLLLGGIARIDVVEGSPSLLLTAMTNLPLHIVPDHDAAAYIRDLGPHLRVPDPAASRASPLPPPAAHDFSLRLPISGERRWQQAGVDVVFGGAGWVSVTVPPSARRRLAQESEESEVGESEETEESDETEKSEESEEETVSVRLRAHFPEGLFCGLRPPLLPFCVQQRGSRIGSTCEFRTPADIVQRKFVDSGRRVRRQVARWARK